MECNVSKAHFNTSLTAFHGIKGGNPIMDSKYFFASLTAIGTLGVFGNVVMLVVLFKNKVSAFTLLLASMSVADILLIVSMVTSLLAITLFNAHETIFVFVPMIQCFIGISSGTASMIGVERFFAIYKPILHRQILTKRKATIAMVLIFSLNIGYIFVEVMGSLNNFDEYAKLAGQFLRRFIPCIVIFIMNTLTGILLTRQARIRQQLSANFEKELQITWTMFVIIIVYFVCMLPGTAHLLLLDLDLYRHDELTFLLPFGYVAEVFNASCNFVIYVLTSKFYRNEYKKIFSCKASI